MADNVKSKRPIDNPLTQQRLPAFQPILSPAWVGCGFLLFFVIFLVFGIVILDASLKTVEVEYDYTDTCELNRNTTYGNPNCRTSVRFNIPQEMVKPVYMYYKLENFYQNHRRYAGSRSETQLGGRYTPYGSTGECDPIRAYGDPSRSEIPDGDVYNPCGLVAWSMFNDTFVLKRDDGSVICNGPQPDGTQCTKRGIAWSSDVDVKFKRPIGESPNRIHNQTYYNEGGHVIPDTEDEDFIVWMRTAALPTFRKLYRILGGDGTIPSGDYVMEISQNFPVKEFGGKKKFVLSTASWIGGKNMFLAIAYLVVSGICLVLAVMFFTGAVIQVVREYATQSA